MVKKGGYQILDLTYINPNGSTSKDEILNLYNQCLKLKNVNKPILCYLEDDINPIFNVDIELSTFEDGDNVYYYINIYHNGHIIFTGSTEDLAFTKTGKFDDYYSYVNAVICVEDGDADTLSFCFCNMIKNSGAKKLYDGSVTTLAEFLNIFGSIFVSMDDNANDKARGSGKIIQNKVSFPKQPNAYTLDPNTFEIEYADVSLYKQ